MNYSSLISMMPKVPAYDPDAQLFFNAEAAAGVTLTTTQKNAVNQWVVDAKAIGIWTKFKAIYPIVGGTATSHKFNLKNPLDTNAAFRLVFYGGGTHSANGYQPNGTNAYADTFLTPSTALSLNNSHLSLYNRTNATSYFNATKIDATNLTNISMAMIPTIADYGGRFMDDTYSIVSSTNALGFYVGNRTLSTQKKYYKNGALGGTFNINSIALPDNILRIGALAGNGYLFYSSGQCAFASIGDGLTDLESQLFYQITEKYQVALSRNINALQSFYYNPAYNNETNAFLFSTQITDNTIQTATNTLVSDLKTANIFTKMKAIYPMVGGTATTHKFNLVNAQDSTAAFALSFIGGWTHSANGALPNGTNAYANTFLIPSTAFANTNNHLSFYSRTTANVGNMDMGAFWTNSPATNPSTYTASNFLAAGRIIDGNAIGYLSNDDTNRIAYTQTNASGMFVLSRTANNSLKMYQNNILKQTNTVVATSAFNTLPQNSIFIGAANYRDSGIVSVLQYSAKQCAFSTIGESLTDAEATALYNAVNAFQVSLGRNV